MVVGEQYDEEGMRRVAWAHRKERMRKQKRKQMLFRRLAKVAGAVAAVLVLVLVVKGMMHGEKPVEDKHGTGSAGTSSTSPLATLENLYGEMEQTQKAQEGNGADGGSAGWCNQCICDFRGYRWRGDFGTEGRKDPYESRIHDQNLDLAGCRGTY